MHETGTAENKENVDDLRHAAFNARGTYVDANDSEEFADGITDALTRIGERRGSASNVLANSTSISTDSFVYQATYTAGAWRGDLLAYPISSAGLGEAKWHAGELIAAYGLRNIFTVDGSDGSTFPNSTQLTTLGTEATALGVDGTELANYLKGDFSQEKRNGGVLRDRKRKAILPLTRTFPHCWVTSWIRRAFYVADSQTVCVGANDGMLHAIDGSITDANGTNTSGGGTERCAYPARRSHGPVGGAGGPVVRTSTTKPHRFFVDGPIVVSARTRTLAEKNYLVGALGRGGRGVYGSTSPTLVPSRRRCLVG